MWCRGIHFGGRSDEDVADVVDRPRQSPLEMRRKLRLDSVYPTTKAIRPEDPLKSP
jgi:hypothetical protein